MSMKKADAEKALQNVVPKYVLIGFAPDGFKGIPATYQMKYAVVNDVNLFDSMIGMDGVRVFELTEMPQDDWLKQRNEYFAKKTLEQEKEQFEKLKAKFDPHDA